MLRDDQATSHAESAAESPSTTQDVASRHVDSTPRQSRKAIVSSFPSDSHTWNLVFLELLLAENGYDVVNLGSCVPCDHLIDRCLAHRPDLIVLSSVNGHGHIEAEEAIEAIRAEPELEGVAVVVGGKLGVLGDRNAIFTQKLLASGFDAVFTDSASPDAFTQFLEQAIPRSLE